MTNPVQNAIEMAKKKAEENASSGGNQVIEAHNTGTQNGVSVYSQPKMKTLDDVGAYGFDVDSFLKVSEYGLQVKNKDGLIDSIIVSIDTSPRGMQAFDCIKSKGTPTVYYKTYDGVNCPGTNGVSLWRDALNKMSQIDPTASPYQGCDITMTLLEDAKANVKGKEVVVAEAGTKLGHATSTTNKANLKAFIDAITDAGLRDAVVEAKVSYEKKTNARGNEWGVITFELLGEHNSDA